MTISEAIDDAEDRIAEATKEAQKAIAAYKELVMSEGPSEDSRVLSAKMNDAALRVSGLKDELDAIIARASRE